MIRTQSTPFFDRMITWSLDHPLSPLSRYGTSALLIAFVAVVRVALITSLLPWLLFIPVTIAIALMLGEGPGMFAAVFATVLAAITIGSPATHLWLTEAQWAGSVLFLCIAAGLARLAGELRAAFRRIRDLNREMIERQAFLSGVLSSSTDCIKVLDLDGTLSFMSEGGMKTMEVNDFNLVKGCPWPDFWRDDGNAEAVKAIANARLGGASHFTGKADTFVGNAKWWDVSVSPILGVDGKVDRILAVSRDMSALLEAQEQQRLLNGELGHRLKNVLALVQSIANQTFRRAENVEDANIAFSARLAALGKATDVLTSTAWQSASFHDVVAAGLTSIDGLRDRIEYDGPTIRLESQVALALTLALHELATNACKYGALSNDSGKVSLTWGADKAETAAEARFNLKWQEIGGPAVVAPTRKGFGSKMIERSLSSYFRGKTLLEYDPAGVVFTIDAPLPKISVAAG